MDFDSALLDFDIDAFVAQAQSQSPPSAFASSSAVSKENSANGSGASSSQQRPFKCPAGMAGSGSPDVSRSCPYSNAHMQDKMKQYFGYSFRGDQLEVVRQILSGNDVAVFWSTGSGKSMCYQLPALITGKTTIVVSPLISLMQDQVISINARLGEAFGHDVAVFLGSGQTNGGEARARALSGKCLLVYVTPEYLNMFHQDLGKALGSDKIGLLAVDEAHCVSEWGHDFRPSYMQVGDFRKNPDLATVPIVSLTATATEKVKRGIASSVGMRPAHFTSRNSVDRANLKIEVKSHSMTDALQLVRREYSNAAKTGGGVGSTVVYLPTRAMVDSFHGSLTTTVGVMAGRYHAGMSHPEREKAHIDFLTGAVPVVVATMAFGMGIDKPDIRRVVHVGAPKSLEEYYQQIGRAGRDGEPSTVTLFYKDDIEATYSSDFYTGQLSPVQKASYSMMLKAMSDYAKQRTCRRGGLMQYFGERAMTRCDNCDMCLATAGTGGGAALEQDLGLEARALWNTVLASGGTGPSQAVSKAKFSPVLYKNKELLAKYKSQEMIKNVMLDSMGSIMTTLEARGHIVGALMNMEINGRKHSWKAFYVNRTKPLSPQVLQAGGALMLLVPAAIREQEEKKALMLAEKKKRTEDELVADGVDIGQVPAPELAQGHGPWLEWHRQIKALRATGRGSVADSKEGLLKAILDWRSHYAQEMNMAPVNVLSDSLARTIALRQLTDPAALFEAGVRVRGAQGALSAVITTYMNRHSAQLAPAADLNSGVGGGGGQREMMFPLPNATPVAYAGWQLALLPKKRPASWETSLDLFNSGRSMQSIALERGLQVKTTLSHLLTALTFGRSMALGRVVTEVRADRGSLLTPPSETEWDVLEVAFRALGTPEGPIENAKFSRQALMRFIPACACFADTDYSQLSQEQMTVRGRWFAKMEWWCSLQRAGVSVAFAPIWGADGADIKRQRTF